jgi:hypothetical protein
MGVFRTRKSTKQFVNDAISIHGDKYDYSKVEYINAQTKVCIICSEHGEFWQEPSAHLSGCGCPKCKCNVYKKDVYGFGVNDMLNTRGEKFYNTWISMLKRCYDAKFHKKNPTYMGCYVCDEWKYLSKFKKWFDANYIGGYELDKDILIQGNKVYSPDTCCFVPRSINACVNYTKKSKKEHPTGVFDSTSGLYYAIIRKNGKNKIIGSYETREDAFDAYKREKKLWIKKLANKYKKTLEPKAYKALCNWDI